MDQYHPLPVASYIGNGPSQQISPVSSVSHFRIPRRSAGPRTHRSPDIDELGQYYGFDPNKDATHAPISHVSDHSEGNILDPESQDLFEMRSIEPLRSNISSSQSSLDRPFKQPGYNLGLRHPRFHWQTPVLAIIFFVAGTGLAVGHHTYLSSLDGNPDSNQSWTGRFSLAFAFLTKTCFSATVALAMKQVLWYTFRRTRKGISISVIDSFFEIQQNPLKLLHLDIWCYCFLATVFAVFLWLLPLILLVSPTSLSTALKLITTTNSECFVPNIDFSTLSLESQSGVSLADSHGTDGVQLVSPIAQKLTALTAYNGEILSWPSPCGSNCSYAIQFNGPAWQCMTSSIDNSSAIPPFLGNASDVWGPSIGGMHSPSYLAAFSNETGLYWVGSSTQEPAAQNADFPSLNISVFYCENWNATFDIHVNYTSSIQNVIVQNITYLNNFSIPYILETAASNGENSIQVPPQFEDTLHYSHAALFRSLGELMKGSIMREPHGAPVLQTNLASIPGLISFNETAEGLSGHYQPVSDLRSAIEDLSRNLTISLLSSPVLQIAYYARTTCYEEKFSTVWVYDPWILWLPYGMAIVVSLGCLFVGGLAVYGNDGEIYDTSFSTVLRTTRNHDLDQLVKDDTNGGQPLSHDVGRARVRLGVLRGAEIATLGYQDGTRRSFLIVR